MPDRYHIHTVPTPPRFRRIGKFGNVDWREDCSRCTNCVKLRCLYDVYRHEAAYNRDPLAPVETWDECKACLSCVQGCTKGLLSVSVNPEFLDLGDEYWKPDILLTTWNQSDTGKIPVSGAGYRGRFHGPGFDSIWTDMSEIVRPTRDGIHGREYISTSVDIGPKPLRLRFTPDGRMLTPPSRLLEIQLPAILDMPAWHGWRRRRRSGESARRGGQGAQDSGRDAGCRGHARAFRRAAARPETTSPRAMRFSKPCAWPKWRMARKWRSWPARRWPSTRS